MSQPGLLAAWIAMALAVSGAIVLLLRDARRRERAAFAVLEEWGRARGLVQSPAGEGLPRAYRASRHGRWSPVVTGTFYGIPVGLALEGGSLQDESPRGIALWVVPPRPLSSGFAVLPCPAGELGTRVRGRGLAVTGDAAFDAEFTVLAREGGDPARLAAFALRDAGTCAALRRFKGVASDEEGRLWVRWGGWKTDPATLDAALDLALKAADSIQGAAPAPATLAAPGPATPERHPGRDDHVASTPPGNPRP